MKVILLQDIAKIGKKFDIKEVSDGYAVNFLLPRKQAKMATIQAIQDIEAQKKKHQDLMKMENEKLNEIITKIKDTKIEIITKTNEEGKLFAGLGIKEIAEAISKQSRENIKPENIEIEKPIKEVGEHLVTILAGNEKTELTVNVKSDK